MDARSIEHSNLENLLIDYYSLFNGSQDWLYIAVIYPHSRMTTPIFKTIYELGYQSSEVIDYFENSKLSYIRTFSKGNRVPLNYLRLAISKNNFFHQGEQAFSNSSNPNYAETYLRNNFNEPYHLVSDKVFLKFLQTIYQQQGSINVCSN